MTSIHTYVLTSERQFRELGSEWDSLLHRCAHSVTFWSHEWLYSWWAAYQPKAHLCIIIAKRKDVIVGIAPLLLEPNNRFTVRPRILRFIGDGTFETDHMSFLVDASCSKEVHRALHRAIDEIPWDIGYFNQMPKESDTTTSLLEFCGNKGWVFTVESVPCPRINLPSSYDALLATLPSRFRSKLRSARRKLETDFNIEFGQYKDTDELPDALNALFANHASRWNAKGEGGVFVDERKQTLYRALAPRLLSRGWLRFFFLKVNGRVIAQQFCFGHERTTLLLQEGFDYSWASHNVGNTLRGMVLEYLMVSGGGVYDFLAGASRNKSTWSNTQKDDLRITVYRGTRGHAWHYTEKTSLRLRAYIRRILLLVGIGD